MSTGRDKSFKLSVLSLMLFGALFLSVAAQDGEGSGKSSGSDLILGDESTFMEIHLSPEGVYGVDSSGEEWEYDFSREKFVDEAALEEYSTQTTFGRSEIRIDLDDLDDFDKLSDFDGIEALDVEELSRLAEKAVRMAEQSLVRRYKGLQLRAVTIEVGEVVNSSVFAIGEVTVKGTVTGDVISYSRVTILSTGLVNGDVRAPEIVKMRGPSIFKHPPMG
ncbi:MAG: polymer-forming cytoskeletal protein, partial [candidate division Zixibacteria bacterium]